jgi:hypothetical protein
MVPVVVELEAPLTSTLSVSVTEVACCAWVAAASKACEGLNGGLAVLPPAEQAARRMTATAERLTTAARLALYPGFRDGSRYHPGDAATVLVWCPSIDIFPPKKTSSSGPSHEGSYYVCRIIFLIRVETSILVCFVCIWQILAERG